MIRALLLSVLIGIAGHRMERPLAEWFPAPDTNRLSRYACGGVLVIAAYPALYLSMDGNHRNQALTALILDLFGVGGGTVTGYLLDLAQGRR